MSAADPSLMSVTLHLLQQTTVVFDAAELWPRHGAYSRFGNDLPSFAEEVTRRLQTDGFIGFSPDESSITVIPIGAVKRVDFSVAVGDRDAR